MNKLVKALLEGELVNRALRKIGKIFFRTPPKGGKLANRLRKGADYVLGTAFRTVYAWTMPVNRKQILFIPFQGDYTCNPKYIAEELLRRDTEHQYTIIFSARRRAIERQREEYPEGVRLVNQYSAEFYKAIMSSEVIVANSVEFLKKPCPKRRGQLLIETWHGSLGIKRFDKAHYRSSLSWSMAAQLCGKRADYIISNSDFEDRVYRETYWERTPILRYGHPRNDLLVKLPEEGRRRLRQKVEEFYQCSLGEAKILLYAPTFRDDHGLTAYGVELEKVLPALRERFGGEWVIMARLHPTVRAAASAYFEGKEHILNVTDYPDMQELLAITDVGVTDYSSWIYDYLLTGRPGFLYASDLSDYQNERGLYYPLSSTPFPLSSSTEELREQILHFDEAAYARRVRGFLEEKGCMEDGNASARVVELILAHMEK